MNINEAMRRIKEFGLSCQLRDGAWLVHHKNGQSDRYNDRDLIHFAASLRNNHWKYDGSKIEIGPGGIHCPCCRPMSKSELKVIVRRANRRKAKIKLNSEIDA